MKRFLAVLIVILLMIVYCNNSNKLYSAMASAGVDYEVLYISDSSSIVSVNKSDLGDVLQKLSICICREFLCGDSFIIEGYSNCINDYIVIDGMKINIQISIRGNDVLIGSPLIEKSF